MNKQMRKQAQFWLKLLLAAVFGLIIALAGSSPDSATTTNSTQAGKSFLSFQEKRVWAHAIFQGLPDCNLPNGPYGALYPLELTPSCSSPSRGISIITRLQAAGIDGLTIDIFGGQDVSWMNYWLQPANGTGIVVAPNLDGIGSEDEAFNLVQGYAALASSNSSAARENGKLVIFTTSTPNLSPASWQNVRNRLSNAGIDTLFLASINGSLSQYNYFPSSNISEYFPAFDAGFVFDDTYMKYWNDIVALFQSYNYPFAGGLMPGYDRETPNGGEVDPQATGLYRQGWQANIDAGVQWTHIATWSDLVEHTGIRPTSDWNSTLSDITAWYAAVLKGQPSPISQPQLYITTPQQVHINQTAPAEALVLNPTANTLTVQIQLFDGNKQAVSQVVSATVGPGQSAAATIPVNPTSLPAKRFLRAHASMLNGQQVVQQVVGAPILIYNAGVKTNLRSLYYSIPAQHALPGRVHLSLSGNPVTGTVAANITPPSGINVRFAEVLQNTWEVKNLFNQAPYTTQVPLTSGTPTVENVITDDPSGFYMARVIDEQERVGYSDPIYYKE